MTVTSGFTTTNRSDFTIEFITLGNCWTCKVRIEAKLSTVNGVKESNYDAFNRITTVTYDELITDAYIIMQAVADTGHDTEWYKAPDAAYQLLIGTCCEYERTIDYSQAQVGYLSLMNLWMPHVSIDESDFEESITVFPTVSNGLFTLNKKDLFESNIHDIKIFSTNGNLVWASYQNTDPSVHIDLSSAPAGHYIVCLFDNNQLISKNRIIKD